MGVALQQALESSVFIYGCCENWYGSALFLECDYMYIKILKLLKSFGRFLRDSYPATSHGGLLVRTFITFYYVVVLLQGKSLKQREPN